MSPVLKKMFTKEVLIRFERISTPFYYYDLGVLQSTLEQLKSEADRYGFLVHYAVKANTNDHLLRAMMNFGLGADCVSGNEVRKSIEIGFNPDKIVFAGVGKSDAEINLALDSTISCFNCESSQELEVINELALAKNKIARIALRINPNVNANTHQYITTGLEENKFGINAGQLEEILKLIQGLKNLQLTGLHFHIGSQIQDLNTFKNLCTRINEIQRWFENRNVKLKHLNVGGGFGISYEEPDKQAIPDFAGYFKVFHDFLDRKPFQRIHFELGRSIVAQCGSLIARVLYIKKGLTTNFAILDAGMTELIRPALYQAYHKIENVSALLKQDSPVKPDSVFLQDAHLYKYDVVGPICESSDCFGKAVELPETRRGDLIAIRSTGAYGEVMASNYNLREKALSVFSQDILI